MTVNVVSERTELWLRLARARTIGPVWAKRLIEKLGSVEAIFSKTPRELVAAGVREAQVRELTDPRLAVLVRDELTRARAKGVSIVAKPDDAYPRRLRELHDPPVVLSVRGELRGDERAIAIVGARRASSEGRRLARSLARDLAAAGVTIVSGLARGIDGAAHLGALDVRGRTIAVMGGGVDVVYPPEHGELAVAIEQAGGAIVSESPLGQGVLPHHFPQRNRIVSGLSLGVLVVEAAQKSGALVTVRHAKEQSRELLAVPTTPLHPLAYGPNSVLKDGAAVVESVQDVLAVLDGERPVGDPAAPERDPTSTPARLLEKLKEADAPLTVEELVPLLQRTVSEVLAAAGRLEAEGAIRQVGGLLERC